MAGYRPPTGELIDSHEEAGARVFTFDHGWQESSSFVQRISMFHGITILMGPAFEALHTMMSSSLTSSADRETGTIAGPNGTDVDPNVLHGDFEPANPAPTNPDHLTKFCTR